MEFLQIDYTTLEIYPKGENSSSIEEINDNSQWICVAKNILDENPDLLSEDLFFFVNGIKNVFNSHVKTIKNELMVNYDSGVLTEFDNCFIDDDVISKIMEFIKKYNMNEENSKLCAVIFNIITINDYIANQIKQPELMNICVFVI